MKTLFKLYLLGQLIALPFMVGAIGGVLGGSSDSSSSSSAGTQIVSTSDNALGLSGSSSGLSQHTASSLGNLSSSELCDALQSGIDNPLLDNYQQLQLAIADLDGDTSAEDCFGAGTQ